MRYLIFESIDLIRDESKEEDDVKKKKLSFSCKKEKLYYDTSKLLTVRCDASLVKKSNKFYA